MVHNHVWHHAFPEYLDLKQYLLRRHPDRKDLASQRATFVGACLACVEMRLGRGLTLADFTDAGINNGIRWGYALAQRGT